MHNVSFTFMVVKYLIDTYFYDSNIVSLKSDNCTVQYKCCKVFPMVQQLAVSYNKTIIWHYGVNGHGKGMVDGMSSFGVKDPMRNAIIQHNWYYENGTDIIDFLQNNFASDHSKSYVMLPIPEVTIPPMGIKGNRKYRMFIYKPDGSVFIKRHMCMCKMFRR